MRSVTSPRFQAPPGASCSQVWPEYIQMVFPSSVPAAPDWPPRGKASRTRSRKLTRPCWFSGSMGSPPRTESPAT